MPKSNGERLSFSELRQRKRNKKKRKLNNKPHKLYRTPLEIKEYDERWKLRHDKEAQLALARRKAKGLI